MSTKTALEHHTILPVQWGDLDALQHVNNAKYFEYMQEARIQWLASLALDLTGGEGPVLLKIGCTFLRPVFYPAELRILSKAHTPGRSSLQVHQELYVEDTKVAEGDSTLVWMNYHQQKSIALPDSIRGLFKDA